MKEVQDRWFREAKAQGYRSRAAFKLLEIDRKRRLLRRGMRVLDVGAAPGSWLQVAAAAVGPKGTVVGVDLKTIDPSDLPEQVSLLAGDARELTLEDLGGRRFDLVISDMAPDTTGDRSGDQARSARLCHDLLDRLASWLRPGGNLVFKVFEGGDYPPLLQRTRSLFGKTKGFKPPASRAESVEMFVIAEGFTPPEPGAPRASHIEGDASGSPGRDSEPVDRTPIARDRPRGWGASPRR